jgi:anti-anti-sigma factor
MSIGTSISGTREIIRVKGDFDYTKRSEFTRISRGALLNSDTKEIVIELGEVRYLDSMACGMLLHLRDLAGNEGKSVALAGAKDRVARALGFLQFNRLFEMRNSVN